MVCCTLTSTGGTNAEEQNFMLISGDNNHCCTTPSLTQSSASFFKSLVQGMWAPAETDLYAVMGASPSDSLQQLRHKYQQLALQYHPDRLVGVGSVEAELSVKKFLEVEEAWRVLSDQSTKTQYDLQRRDELMYTHCCRCGGQFSVSQEEVEDTTHPCQKGDAGTEERQQSGVVVCCDTCSLSVNVTWTTDRKAKSLINNSVE